MSKLNTSPTLQTANAASTNAPSGILQRKCASCDTHTVAGDKCEDCKNKQGVLQRKSSNNSDHSEVPPIVHEVLNSSGQPLDKSTRAFFESRFDHNFSKIPISSTSPQLAHNRLTIGEPTDVYEQEADRIADSIMLKEKHENKSLSANQHQGAKFDLSHVRIHTDSRAAASARAVNALAYTVGNNIVFGAGQFEPATYAGRQLLAHELTHVAQQGGNAATVQRWSIPQFAAPDTSAERAAAVAEAEAIAGHTTEQLEAEAEAEAALALNDRRSKDKNYAWSLGLKDKARIQKKGKLSPGHQYEVITKLRFFQGEAKAAYLRTISPALGDFAEAEQVSEIMAEFDSTGKRRGQKTQKSCDIGQNQYLLQYEGESSEDRCMVKTDPEFNNNYFDHNIVSARGLSVEGTTWENVEYNRFNVMLVKYKNGTSEYFMLNEVGNFYYGIIRGLLEHTYLKRKNGLIYPIYNGKIYFNDYLTPNIISRKAGLEYQVKELQELYKLLQVAGTFASIMGSYGAVSSPSAYGFRSSLQGFIKLKGSRATTTTPNRSIPTTTHDTPAASTKTTQKPGKTPAKQLGKVEGGETGSTVVSRTDEDQTGAKGGKKFPGKKTEKHEKGETRTKIANQKQGEAEDSKGGKKTQTADDTQKSSTASTAKPVLDDPQRGVKDALERSRQRLNEGRAEVNAYNKQIEKARQNANTAEGKRKLAELEGYRDHQVSLNQLEQNVVTRLSKALDAKTFVRPKKHHKGVRDTVWQDALKEGNGRVLSPSGTEIKPGDPSWVMGHKPKYEFWKHQRSAAERGISREQFIKEHNDPRQYRPETKEDSDSHFYEDKTDTYWGY